MLQRPDELARLQAQLRRSPVVALLGPRQVGKTTLARVLARTTKGDSGHFDLEDPRDQARLADPMLALSSMKGLVIIDEIQTRPDLFAVLRVLADRPRRPARFLVLGSASPELMRRSSETLAGRVAFHELKPFSVHETGIARWARLWLRGGFPRSFLARTNQESYAWRQDFVRTFLERDLPGLGVSAAPATMRRFWSMLAHHHAQVWNGAELARAFGMSESSVRRYLDTLVSTFVVRALPPWHANIGKRQVKAPRVYLADTGLLHALLEIRDERALNAHPKVGASWEGFALDVVTRTLGAEARECFFWRTHQGAELDLLVVRGRHRLGFEFKRTDSPALTPSMRSALADLHLDSLTVVHAGQHTFSLAPRVRAVPLPDLARDLAPLR